MATSWLAAEACVVDDIVETRPHTICGRGSATRKHVCHSYSEKGVARGQQGVAQSGQDKWQSQPVLGSMPGAIESGIQDEQGVRSGNASRSEEAVCRVYGRSVSNGKPSDGGHVDWATDDGAA